ncbi:hypothetical protein niasHS_002264 [Heterodera schachtii]|uniref:Leishmanolysin-like peptidase n=1 Tax=Heterodera schachtii TaxID=97005 RepID=A0ABD2KMR6_HETSC
MRNRNVLFAPTFVWFLCSSVAFFLLIASSPRPFSVSSCSYQVPGPDQLTFGVPLLRPFPFSPPRPAPFRRPRRAQQRRLFRRDLALSRDFRPLRIHLHFDPVSIESLPPSKQLFINSTLLPRAISFWQKSLLVRPANVPIRLSRKCESNQYYSDQSSAFLRCVTRCKAITNCGEVQVPDAHLFQCRFCLQSNPLSCIPSGPSDGPGVSDTDFLLYVSAVDTQRCRNEETIAYAAHCQQESELDRPIAGHVNICPGALSTHAHDQEVLLSTVKHEILHALGFSAGLYAFFRDAEGKPRSKRNLNNRPLSFNRERGYYDADPSTVRTVVREDWWTAEGQIPHPIHLMVTERVREEARRHFTCDRLEGAELENQGGDGTAMTHWEKRLFENEAMTGTHTQNPVYSRLTLALMEDSGWYRANYSTAEQLHWGHGLGCSFAMESCGKWIWEKLESNQSTAPFCANIKHDGSRSLATTRCTDQRDSLALCNLVPYKKPLPIDYRNFAHLHGVRHEGTKYYGGSVELADFCPYNQEFEWRAVNSTDRRDSRCELLGNAPTDSVANAVLEIYGIGSRCFDLAAYWTERKCGRIRTYSQFMAGCYAFVCSEGRLHIRLHNSTRLYTCFRPGQTVHIRRIVDGWLREGRIACPPCEEMCPQAAAGKQLRSVDDQLRSLMVNSNQLMVSFFLGKSLLFPRQTTTTEVKEMFSRSINSTKAISAIIPCHRCLCLPPPRPSLSLAVFPLPSRPSPSMTLPSTSRVPPQLR